MGFLSSALFCSKLAMSRGSWTEPEPCVASVSETSEADDRVMALRPSFCTRRAFSVTGKHSWVSVCPELEELSHEGVSQAEICEENTADAEVAGSVLEPSRSDPERN